MGHRLRSRHGLLDSNQGSATATVCNAEGEAVGEGNVQVAQGPTGVVYNGDAAGFALGDAAAPSAFIFATVGGGIFGWSDAVDPTRAVQVVDASAGGASYTGLAMADDGDRSLLYAADFHDGLVDVYDSDFAPVDLGADAFVDPDLPDGYAPFGIHDVGGEIYVAFAKQDANAEEEEAGPGWAT